MELKDLKLGTKLDLQIFEPNNNNLTTLLKSEFEWLEEDDLVVIAAPIYQGELYKIRLGAIIDIYYINKRSLYKFKSTLIERDIREGLSLLKLKAISDIEKIQRRQYYRLECILPIKYCVYNDQSDTQKGHENIYQDSFTKDLGGGGLNVLFVDEVQLNTIVEFKLELNEKSSINFIGKVIRAADNGKQNKYKYEVGIVFKKIDNKARESIISFILQEQRKLIKKGLI